MQSEARQGSLHVVTEREMVVVVDESGSAQAIAGKQIAHEPPGMLHLAFSVFVFSLDGRLLLQQRARSKYHFAGVWANTCCSHPMPGEDVARSAQRRLAEELSLGKEDLVGPLRVAGSFVYRAQCPTSGLVEHEYDYVLVGTMAPEESAEDQHELRLPGFDTREVEAVRWALPVDVLGAGPSDGFAPWFAEALEIAISIGRPT